MAVPYGFALHAPCGGTRTAVEAFIGYTVQQISLISLWCERLAAYAVGARNETF